MAETGRNHKNMQHCVVFCSRKLTKRARALRNYCFYYFFPTSGHAYWNSQKIFRAMYTNNFNEWRPHLWQSIIKDYGFQSDIIEDDYLEGEEANESTSNFSATKSFSTACVNSSSLEDKVDQIITMLKKEEEKKSLEEVFKCSICLETCSNLMTSCTHPKGCGRLLGCFTCFYDVLKCPLCRNELPPPKERKPLIISGLESILGVHAISFASALSQVGSQNVSSDSDDDDLMQESLPLAAARASADQQ